MDADNWLADNDPEYSADNPDGDAPCRTFCDGPYRVLAPGCYRRLPAIVSDELVRK